MGDRPIHAETLVRLIKISVAVTQICLFHISILNPENLSLKSAVTFDIGLALQIGDIDCDLRIKMHTLFFLKNWQENVQENAVFSLLVFGDLVIKNEALFRNSGENA